MIKGVYTILDEKAQNIGPLFICENDQVAERIVRSSYTDRNSIPCRYPSDFSLLCLGDIETVNGCITARAVPTLVSKLDSLLEV